MQEFFESVVRWRCTHDTYGISGALRETKSEKVCGQRPMYVRFAPLRRKRFGLSYAIFRAGYDPFSFCVQGLTTMWFLSETPKRAFRSYFTRRSRFKFDLRTLQQLTYFINYRQTSGSCGGV